MSSRWGSLDKLRDRESASSNQNVDPESRRLVNRPGNASQSFNTSQSIGGPKTARDENFFQALHIMLCPKFTVFSALFWISFIQISIFVAEIVIGGVQPTSFLAASNQILETLGQKDPYKMRYSFELHRFFFPMFLHGDLGHLCSNIIAQLMIGSQLEPDIGSLKFMALYFLSGVGGITFSALCSDSLSMGASTAVFGLSGCYVAFIILNFHYLQQQPNKFCQVIIFLVISLFLTVMLGSKNIDVLGHLGGFITGALCGLWLLPCLETTMDKLTRARTLAKWGKVATAIFFGAMLVCFFTLRDPQNRFSPTVSASDAALPQKEVSDSLAAIAQEIEDEKQSQVDSEAQAEAGLDGEGEDAGIESEMESDGSALGEKQAEEVGDGELQLAETAAEDEETAVDTDLM